MSKFEKMKAYKAGITYSMTFLSKKDGENPLIHLYFILFIQKFSMIIKMTTFIA